MSVPVRIQLSRRKGWRKPPNTVSVARPSAHGNPFVIGRDGSAEECVAKFRAKWTKALASPIALHLALARTLLRKLRGKNLGCWCRLCPEHADGKPFDVHCDQCAPCHADVLGELANRGNP